MKFSLRPPFFSRTCAHCKRGISKAVLDVLADLEVTNEYNFDGGS